MVCAGEGDIGSNAAGDDPGPLSTIRHAQPTGHSHVTSILLLLLLLVLILLLWLLLWLLWLLLWMLLLLIL
jgi:fatty acid desaturase